MDEDILLLEVLKRKGKDSCPKCGRKIDRGDLSWNNSTTEAGTDYSVVECQCQECFSEVFMFHTWYPSIDTIEELIQEIDFELDDSPSGI